MARNQPLTPTRREFCVASAAALVGLSIKGDRPLAGGFVNDDMPIGHALRGRAAVGAAATTVRIPIVIVGGGMAGLSAAWRLQKRGFDRFVLLEMSGQRGRQLALRPEPDDGRIRGVRTTCRSRTSARRMCASSSRSWAC